MKIFLNEKADNMFVSSAFFCNKLQKEQTGYTNRWMPENYQY